MLFLYYIIGVIITSVILKKVSVRFDGHTDTGYWDDDMWVIYYFLCMFFPIGLLASMFLLVFGLLNGKIKLNIANSCDEVE